MTPFENRLVAIELLIMCGRFVITHNPRSLEERFGAPFVGSERWEGPRFNAAPGQLLPVVVRDREGPRIRLMRWGYLPRWARAEMAAKRMINARVETVFEKPFFRDAVRQHRCLVPTEGFFEWKKAGNQKHPHFIHWQGDLLAFAGIWDTWRNPETGETDEAFAIITLPANDQVVSIHDRMPAVLPRAHEDEWLAKALPGVELEKDAAEVRIAMHEVSRRVNSPSFNSPDLLSPE